jgi:nucleoside-diphosphate-sugar epimerase
MPVVAVTGSTGFVGRSLVQSLAESDPDLRLRLLVRRDPVPTALQRHQIIAGDLADADALARLVDGADAVVHVAAAIGGNDAGTFDRVNVAGTRRLVDAVLARAPASHFIHVSSLAAREPELSWYAASKRAAEEVVRSRLARTTVLRPPAVYGPDDPALADFWRLLARGWLIRLGRAHARFSLLHVADLVAAIGRAVRSEPCRDIVTLAGPQPEEGWTWPALAATAAQARGAPVRVVAVPPVVLGGIALGSRLIGRLARHPAVLTPGKARELLHADWVCDNLAASRCLGMQPVTRLQQALGTLPGWNSR